MGFPLTALMGGATAFVGANAPMTALGITDPSKWSTTDWLADIIPHAAYGVAAAGVLRLTT